MQHEDSQQITKRFFEAIYALKAKKIIRGKQTFTTRYGIERRNLCQLEKEPQRDMFKLVWLKYLVEDYGISAHWLITGNGEIFTK